MSRLYLLGASIGEPVTVVCYCSLGYRSSALAQQLAYELDKPVHQELKSKTVIYNLEGSIFKWANEGKDLEDNKGRKTVYVHPYNIVWGKLLNAELRSSEPCESRQETAMQTSLTEAKMYLCCQSITNRTTWTYNLHFYRSNVILSTVEPPHATNSRKRPLLLNLFKTQLKPKAAGKS